MERKDYYKILNIDRNATIDDIKTSFRKLAKEHHPDKGGNAEKFKEINEAYSILSDPDKRKEYDNPMQGIFSGFNSASGVNVHDIMNDFMFKGFRKERNARDKPVTKMKVDVSIKEAFLGATKNINFVRNRIVGSAVKCAVCNGQGYIERRINMGFGGIAVSQDFCNACAGQGIYYPREQEEISLQINIPKGCLHNAQFIYPSYGNEYAEKSFGDLAVYINSVPDEIYDRNGQDLIVNYFVSFPKLLLGGDLIINVFDSQFKVNIKSGKESLQVLRLKGKGFDNGSNIGDLYVRIIPELPDELNANEINLLNNLLNEEHFS